ncbi:MAG TPA: hypothetical protein VJ570_13670 [Holophagaceae bacterium]|nr:hypothetical protein [Holophagaceae bacterium]
MNAPTAAALLMTSLLLQVPLRADALMDTWRNAHRQVEAQVREGQKQASRFLELDPGHERRQARYLKVVEVVDQAEREFRDGDWCTKCSRPRVLWVQGKADGDAAFDAHKEQNNDHRNPGPAGKDIVDRELGPLWRERLDLGKDIRARDLALELRNRAASALTGLLNPWRDRAVDWKLGTATAFNRYVESTAASIAQSNQSLRDLRKAIEDARERKDPSLAELEMDRDAHLLAIEARWLAYLRKREEVQAALEAGEATILREGKALFGTMGSLGSHLAFTYSGSFLQTAFLGHTSPLPAVMARKHDLKDWVDEEVRIAVEARLKGRR